MEKQETVTLETVLTLAKKLSAVNKLKLAEHLLQELEPIIKAHEPVQRKSLRGILKGQAFTEEEIAEARREMWGTFGEREL